MVLIPAGTYTRGQQNRPSNGADFPEELPAHQVQLDAFYLDTHEVTNADFAAFVAATGYTTQAERGWSATDFPAATPDMLQPGAMCFLHSSSQQRATAENIGGRWVFVPGASWEHPFGPSSDIKHLMDHPVVCVTYEDATAYASWAGKRLPTEAEWERAARGGHEGRTFPWGNTPTPQGEWLANVFQGTFPSKNTALDGHVGAAPVGSFPANDFGLYDMAGNVWEICADYFSPTAYQKYAHVLAVNPTGPEAGMTEMEVQSYFRNGRSMVSPPISHPLTHLRVTRGGSYLCHVSYCLRYRCAARFYAESLAPTNHVGFRCAKDASLAN